MKPTKIDHRLRRKKRIRAKIYGTATKPRLTVFLSLSRVYAQLIDDVSQKTVAAAFSKKGKGMKDAAKVGEDIAAKAKALKITSLVFDRNGRRYHGRVKALADAVRAAGLQF